VSLRWPLPSVGDIVWCQFPELPLIEPGPKPRPALVVSVDVRSDGCNLQVAYGTSKRVTQLKSGEFAITRPQHPAAFALAGLAFDTKFDCRALVALPWTERYFKVPPRPVHGQTPKLGTLHASVYQAAHAAFEAAQS
jgi:mRNA-degrading endonuclease toxin of MazEF toxin-antitoxin module